MRQRLRIHLVGAARPNFMKLAPLHHALGRAAHWADPVVIHTGQHYDTNMSDLFFRDLGLPETQVNLGVGSGTHAEQTAAAMVAYERLCLRDHPDWVIVVGDVNSTLACALAAKKLCLQVAHLEAGLRSRDRSMPEEINRVVTDALADLLWTPSPDADENLQVEGIPSERIERVGNIMIDSLELARPQIDASTVVQDLGLAAKPYALVTLHRPATVDHPEMLAEAIEALLEVSKRLAVVFAVHPRTRASLERFDLARRIAGSDRVILLDPLGYVSFAALLQRANCAITDSGGIQEETTYLDIPCLTLRETTERPITLTQGSNKLVTVDRLADEVEIVLSGGWPRARRPELWDGHTADRVVSSLLRHSSLA